MSVSARDVQGAAEDAQGFEIRNRADLGVAGHDKFTASSFAAAGEKVGHGCAVDEAGERSGLIAGAVDDLSVVHGGDGAAGQSDGDLAADGSGVFRDHDVIELAARDRQVDVAGDDVAVAADLECVYVAAVDGGVDPADGVFIAADDQGVGGDAVVVDEGINCPAALGKAGHEGSDAGTCELDHVAVRFGKHIIDLVAAGQVGLDSADRAVNVYYV